jgi:hypothetical protein
MAGQNQKENQVPVRACGECVNALPVPNYYLAGNRGEAILIWPFPHVGRRDRTSTTSFAIGYVPQSASGILRSSVDLLSLASTAVQGQRLSWSELSVPHHNSLLTLCLKRDCLYGASPRRDNPGPTYNHAEPLKNSREPSPTLNVPAPPVCFVLRHAVAFP